MKKFFKFDKTRNQHGLNYKGKWIYIDHEDFQNMTDDEIENLVKQQTTQKENQKRKENYVDFEEFKSGLDDVRAFIKRENPNISFKEFLKMRHQPNA